MNKAVPNHFLQCHRMEVILRKVGLLSKLLELFDDDLIGFR